MKTLLESANMDIRHENQHVHVHAFAELYISLDGYAINSINGYEFQTLPMDVYVLTEDMRHGQPVTHNYRFCIFKFNFDVLKEQLGALSQESVFQTLFVTEPALRRNGLLKTGLQIDMLTAEYAVKTAQLLERTFDPTLRDTLFFSLVSVICKNARSRVISDDTSNYEQIFATASYMETHYAEPIDLEILAEQANYSVRHYTRLFRLCYNVSPMDYLNQIRLKRAAALLHNPQLSLSRVSELCGFSSSSLFSKVFHKYFGHTPSAYRKNIRLDAANAANALENAAIVEY